MDYFYMNGRLYIMICDYFCKFPFLLQTKTMSFANLKDHLQELFSVEGTPDEIMSNNGPPFNGKEFSSFLTDLGIRHTTSSPNYPRSNGFIERQIQTVKRLMEKYTKSHDNAKRAKDQQTLVIGEEVYFLSGKNEWQIGTVTGTTDTGRSYNILIHKGTSLRRNRAHLKPRCHDIPIIAQNIACRTSTPSQSEITENQLLRTEHPPKVKYSYNNKQYISFQDHYEQHPPKVKYFLETVPKIVIRCIGDTAYDSYISETLYPLKSAIKPRKQTRFAGDPESSVKTIPARRTRSHPPK